MAKRLNMNFVHFPKDIPTILATLQPATAAKWGQMTAQHMLEHLIVVTKISIGQLTVKPLTPAEEWAQRKAFLQTDKPFPKHLANPALPKQPMPLHYPSFEDARQKLLATLQAYEEFWSAHENATHLHPIFGPLNYAEWERFHTKHYTHHFAQFGLL